MSLSVCTRCMSQLQLQQATRPPLALSSSLVQTSLFHTSSALASAAKNRQIPYRVVRSAVKKKKKTETRRIPPVGERRQQRTRLVLSNTNALEVKGLEDLSPRNINSPESVGRILGFDGAVIDQLRELRAFKRNQNWSLFRRPAALVTPQAVDIGNMITSISQGLTDGKPEMKRVVVNGERASGKSILLLQAQAMALLNNWVVINIPDAQEFANDHFAYAPIPKAKEADIQMYSQSTLAAAILSRTANANAKVLAKLKPNSPPPEALGIAPEDAKNLHTIAAFGGQKPAIASKTLTYLLSELTAAGKEYRPPSLLAVDGLDHWMGPSAYHAADHSVIHSHQMQLVRIFLDRLFSSSSSFANGGIALAATTRGNTRAFPSFRVLLDQLRAQANGVAPSDPSFPLPGPYSGADSNVLGLLDTKASTQLMELKGVSREHAASLLNYYFQSGILQEALTPHSVNEKWMVSGGGVLGQLCSQGVRARIDPAKVLTRWGTMEGVKIGQGEHRPIR